MPIRTLSSLKSVKGKRILLRVDFNIPLGPDGSIGHDEDLRLRAALPTVERLAAAGAKVIIVSHLGRPKGREKKFSLAPVAAHFAKLLGHRVLFVEDSLTASPERVAGKLATLLPHDVAMLENVRFYPGEEKNDPAFVRALAALADVYVNDAFGAAHRAHASTAGVAKRLPAYAGYLMEAEIKNLSRLLRRPPRPFTVIMGGAKVSTKLPTIKKLLTVADRVLIGGGLANSFFRAQGLEIGKSVADPEEVKLAKELLKNRKIILPTDVLAATSTKETAKARYCRPDEVKKGETVVDIGPETAREWAALVRQSSTIVWNGPLGIFEVRKFSHGTVALARVIAARSRGRAFGVIGGGETIQAAERTGMTGYIDHVSTGGGAMLEFLAGKALPGVKPLMRVF